MKTGWTASRLAACMFILPFMFVYNPDLILIHGLNWDVVPIIITSIIGITSVSMALQGYIFSPIKWWVRVILFIAGLCLIYPGIVTDSFGLIISALIVTLNYKFKKKPQIV